jgi:hypothetical protein
MWNTYCFSTATVVVRMRFSVTLYVHCLSCLMFIFTKLSFRIIALWLMFVLPHVALYLWSTGLGNTTILAKMKMGVALHEVCSVEYTQEFALPMLTGWWQPCWMYIVFCKRRGGEVYSFRHAYRVTRGVVLSPVVIPGRKYLKHVSDSQGLLVYDNLNEGE